jgi:endonuclease YncB( thermonuclease family)
MPDPSELERQAEEDPPRMQMVFPPRDGEHKIVIREVVDGDTVKFAWMIEGVARIKGIDAPEIHGPNKAAGLDAKTYLRSILPTIVDAIVYGSDKYGRTLLDIRLPDGLLVSEVMVRDGHAKPYDGGKR